MKKAIEITLAVVIVGTSFAFGGVQPLTYTLVELVVFAALAAVLIRQSRRGEIHLRVPFWPVLFAIWAVVPIFPVPRSAVAKLQPGRFLSPAATLVHGPSATLSIDPHLTLLAWMKFLLYLAAFLLAIYLFDSRQRRSLLVRTLVVLGLFEAGYGFFQYTTGWHKIFGYNNPDYPNSATGTYINHNHYAGVLELTLPFVIALVFYSFQSWLENRHTGHSREAKARRTSAAFRLAFYSFLSVVMVVAIIFSRSRAGIMGALVTILVLGFLVQLKTRRRAWMLGLIAFLLLAFGYGSWVGLGPVLSRFEMVGAGAQYLQSEGRLQFWHDTLGIVRDYPWTGTGLGTFPLAYRHYQTSWVNYFVDHPHNDYLEFASETGLPGVVLLFLPIVYLLGWMIVSFLSDSRRYRPAVTLGCIGSVLALLLHSIFDFNLQIPANALIFAIVLGIGYKTCIERRQEPPDERRVRQQRSQRRAMSTTVQ